MTLFGRHSTTVFAVILATMLASSAAVPAGPAGEQQLEAVSVLAPSSARSSTGSSATADRERSAYLMSYFKDETHSLYFAVSRDGYTFTDVNDGKPVLSGRAIADQKGIRDPHITRGPDGSFYMAMTDLHIFGLEEGLRTTAWERPEDRYGWGNNRNLLLMKSRDMIHWTLARVDVGKLFPSLANAGTAWAPETIYDPVRKKMMVYFSTRIGTGPLYMVSSYADPEFKTLTTEPVKLLTHPDPKISTIDADITRVGNQYRMFYVGHENPGGIFQAVSNTIGSGYVYTPQRVAPETLAHEAPNLWRRYGTDTYVLMYDVFGAKPNNMGFAETKDFKTFTKIGRFNDPGSRMKTTNFTSPKHGSVMPITSQEAERLEAYFAGM